MRSRATSTKRKQPDWRTWVLFDYARYWYAIGVMMLLVFGVGEVARQWQPIGALQAFGLVLLSGSLLFIGIAGYIWLWRRDTPAGERLQAGVRRVRAFVTTTVLRLVRRFPGAAPKDPPGTGGEEQEGGPPEGELPGESR